MTFCPACSGTGCIAAKVRPDCFPCRLCAGVGEITEATEEAFWECIRTSGKASQPIKCAGDVSGWADP